MILVQFLHGDYWTIENVFYSNPEQYTPKENQKIIENHNWQFKQNGEAELVSNLIWDEKDKQVIIYPDHLKVSLHKERVLKECREMLKNNLRVLDPQVLQSIAAKIKNAATIEEVDAAKSEISTGIDNAIKGLGF